MTITVTRINNMGEKASEVSATFNNVDDYFQFLEKMGIYIKFKDAIEEFSQGNVVYRLPLEV